MKRLIRMALIFLAVIVIIIVTPQLILTYPVLLFHEGLTHKNFIVLSERRMGE